MEQRGDGRGPSQILVGGIIVALIPAVGFDLAHSYESGYADAYGYPTDLINLQLGSVFQAVTALILFVLVVYNVAFIVSFLWGKPGPMTYYFGVPLGLAALGISFVLIYGSHWQHWIWFFLTPTLLGLVFLALPFLTQRQHRTLTAKITAQVAAEREGLTRTLHARVVTRLGFGALLLIAAVIVLVGWANALGEAAALNQRDYLVLNVSGHQEVLLRVYGTEAIFAPLETRHHTLQQRIIIHDLSQSLSLEWQSIGPLNLDPTNRHR